MRIICPTCASHYEVEIDQIGAAGQLVRCAQCREVWLVQAPQASCGTKSAATKAPERDSGAFAAAFEAHARATSDPIDFQSAKQRLRRGTGGDARRRGGSAALIAIGAACIGVAGLAVTFRAAVVDHWPATAGVFAAIDLPVAPGGLALRGVRSVMVAEGNKTVLSLEGEIANLRDEATTVPNITVVVRDDAQTPLYTWTTVAPKARLAKGETIAFHSRLAAPPTDGRDVRVTFADAGAIGPVRP